MRYTLTVSDALNSDIETLAAEVKISKNAWIINACTTFIETCTADGADPASERDRLQEELTTITVERDHLKGQILSLSTVTEERDQALEALTQITADWDQLSVSLAAVTTDRDMLKADIASRDQALADRAEEIRWLRGEVSKLNDKLTPATLSEQAGPGRRSWWSRLFG